MRTYPLASLWHRTVRGTELEHANWDDIAKILLRENLIGLVAGRDKVFDRYYETDRFPPMSKPQYKQQILKVLRDAGL